MKKREKMKQKFLLLISLLVGIFTPGAITNGQRSRHAAVSCESAEAGELYEACAAAKDAVQDQAEPDKVVSISRGKNESDGSEPVKEEEGETGKWRTKIQKGAKKGKAVLSWAARRKPVRWIRRLGQGIASGFRKFGKGVGKMARRPVFRRHREEAAA